MKTRFKTQHNVHKNATIKRSITDGEGDYVAPFGLNKTTIYGYNVASCVEGLLDTESGSSLLD